MVQIIWFDLNVKIAIWTTLCTDPPSSLVAIKAINSAFLMATKTAPPDMWMGFLRAYYHEETIMLTVHRAESNGKGNIYSYEIFHNQDTCSWKAVVTDISQQTHLTF